jgi:hypothetical protein
MKQWLSTGKNRSVKSQRPGLGHGGSQEIYIDQVAWLRLTA